MEERVRRYCRLTEKDVWLSCKRVGGNLAVAEGCSEANCPMRGSASCLLNRVIEVFG